MTPVDPQAAERFLLTLEVVSREGRHLAYSWGRLGAEPVDADWVSRLDRMPELAERLEAFTSRYGRMQDTIAEKLLPRWLLALAERPGSQIETLNRAERLGVIESVEQWLEARKLRNRPFDEPCAEQWQIVDSESDGPPAPSTTSPTQHPGPPATWMSLCGPARKTSSGSSGHSKHSAPPWRTTACPPRGPATGGLFP